MIRTLQLTHLEKIITVLNGRKKIKFLKFIDEIAGIIKKI